MSANEITPFVHPRFGANRVGRLISVLVRLGGAANNTTFRERKNVKTRRNHIKRDKASHGGSLIKQTSEFSRELSKKRGSGVGFPLTMCLQVHPHQRS